MPARVRGLLHGWAGVVHRRHDDGRAPGRRRVLRGRDRAGAARPRAAGAGAGAVLLGRARQAYPAPAAPRGGGRPRSGGKAVRERGFLGGRPCVLLRRPAELPCQRGGPGVGADARLPRGRAALTTAGYSGKALALKLGIKPGMTVTALAAPAHYRALLRPLPAGARIATRLTGRRAVRDFAEREVRPRVAAMERAAALDPALLAKFFELGLMGIEIGEQYGGAGGNLLMSVLAVEELSAVDASTAIFVDVQNTLVNALLLKWASDDLKRRYLPRLATDCVGAYALSEPASGSDAFGLQTKATRQGDRWILDGRKLWITNGAEAGLYVIFANVDFSLGYKGITAFAVERGFKGFAIGKREDKLGIRASSTTELILDQCAVPGGNVIGDVGKGYKVAIETLNTGRIGIGAQMIGVARGALTAALKYVRERH